jgi:hypothetical protein
MMATFLRAFPDFVLRGGGAAIFFKPLPPPDKWLGYTVLGGLPRRKIIRCPPSPVGKLWNGPKTIIHLYHFAPSPKDTLLIWPQFLSFKGGLVRGRPPYHNLNNYPFMGHQMGMSIRPWKVDFVVYQQTCEYVPGPWGSENLIDSNNYR